MEPINWKEEEVREPAEFESKPVLNFESGETYEFEVLDDGVKVPCRLPDNPERTVEKILLTVKYKGGTYVVFFPLGSTLESAFGQLKTIADRHGGHLQGVRLKLVVAGEGKSRRYSIKEASASSSSNDKPKLYHSVVSVK